MSGHGNGGALRTAVSAGVAADFLFGDPRRFDPVAGFGQIPSAYEALLWRPHRFAGAPCALPLVALTSAAAAHLERRTTLRCRFGFRAGHPRVAVRERVNNDRLPALSEALR